jgi:hypothetical protein
MPNRRKLKINKRELNQLAELAKRTLVDRAEQGDEFALQVLVCFSHRDRPLAELIREAA